MGWAGRMVVGFWILLLIVHMETGAYPTVWMITTVVLGIVLVGWAVLSLIVVSKRRPKEPD